MRPASASHGASSAGDESPPPPHTEFFVSGGGGYDLHPELKPEAADVRAAFGRGETGGDPRLEKIAEELGAVTNALAHLIVERGRGPRA